MPRRRKGSGDRASRHATGRGGAKSAGSLCTVLESKTAGGYGAPQSDTGAAQTCAFRLDAHGVPDLDSEAIRRCLRPRFHFETDGQPMLLNIGKKQLAPDIVVLELTGRFALGRESQRVQWQVEELLREDVWKVAKVDVVVGFYPTVMAAAEAFSQPSQLGHHA